MIYFDISLFQNMENKNQMRLQMKLVLQAIPQMEN